eukprot:692343-Prymnesium_polylepis.1
MLDRAGVTINAFVVAAGFGIHLTLGRAGPPRPLWRFYASRVHRIYLTVWLVTMPAFLIYAAVVEVGSDAK